MLHLLREVGGWMFMCSQGAEKAWPMKLLQQQQLWWEGPEFLKLSEDEWPKKHLMEVTDEKEVRKHFELTFVGYT